MGAGRAPIRKKRNICDKIKEIHVSQSIKRPIQDMIKYEKGVGKNEEKEKYITNNLK